MSHGHQFSNASDAREFIYGGNATFTVVSKETGTRFTYKLRQRENTIWFASVLNGPDNWSNYQYIGFLREQGQLQAGRKGHPDAPSYKALNWVLKHLENDNIPSQLEIWHEGKCGRCGRKLTVPESIERGIGPECAKHFA